MKKKLLSLVIFLMLLLVPISVFAEETDKKESVDYYNHSYFEAGNELSVDKNVDGISFIAGNIVKFNGNSTYGALAGENVTINKNIEKDLFAAGNFVTIEKDATIGRDAYLAGTEINIKSNMNGNIFAAGTKVVLDNVEINGNVNLATNELIINGNVKISGKLIINEDAKISGEDKLSVISKDVYKSVSKVEIKTTITNILLGLLTVIFTGILLAVIFPKLFTKLDDEFNVGKVSKYSLYGFVALIAIPILSIVLMGTIVGLTFGFIVLLFYILMLLLAIVFSSYVFGKYIVTKLFKQNDNLYLNIIVGISLFKLISYVPYIGGLIYFISFIYGIGLIINLFLNRNK